MPQSHYGQQGQPQEGQPPLSIVTERLDLTPDGRFRPSAFVKLTGAIRTSGLLQALPPEELKSFLVLLSFLTPNGHCWPTIQQLAGAMRVSRGKARTRMRRLCEILFRGEPLASAAPHGDGQEAYVLNHRLVPTVEQAVPEAKPETLRAVPREQVIEYSRQCYARTREEVEKQIAELNGWDLKENDAERIGSAVVDDETAPSKELKWRLQNLGLSGEQIEYLFTNFEEARIQRQLDWLPYRRQARNPSAYLVAAVARDYGEPVYRR